MRVWLLARDWLCSHIAAGVLQVVWAEELLYRLPQVVIQEPSDQLVALQVQGAVDGGQAAVNGHVWHCVT